VKEETATKGEGEKVAHSHFSKPTNKQSSVSTERLTRRIARNRPDILEEMKAGK